MRMSLPMRPPLARCCCCPVRRWPFAFNFNINSFFFCERELYLIRPFSSPCILAPPLSFASSCMCVSLFCFYGASISVGWLDSRLGGVSPAVQRKTEKMHNSFYSSRKKNHTYNSNSHRCNHRHCSVLASAILYARSLYSTVCAYIVYATLVVRYTGRHQQEKNQIVFLIVWFVHYQKKKKESKKSRETKQQKQQKKTLARIFASI